VKRSADTIGRYSIGINSTAVQLPNGKISLRNQRYFSFIADIQRRHDRFITPGFSDLQVRFLTE
jgi:hypothetical protein